MEEKKIIIPEEIIRAAQNGRLVLFIGNGVSRLLGYPSWGQLAEGLLKQLYDEKNGIEYINFAEKELLKRLPIKKRISIILDITKEKNIKSDFRKILKADECLEKRYYDIYEMLFSLGAAFVTTNYDMSLDGLSARQKTSESISQLQLTAAGAVIKTTKVFYKKQDINIAHVNSGSVIHLHGSLEDETSMVLTTRDYLQHYTDPVITTFFKELFSKKTVLFIGFGMDEEDILEYVLRKQETGGEKKNVPDHYCFFPKNGKDDLAFTMLDSYYRKNCNVGLIEYDISKKGYPILREKIIELHEALKDQVNDVMLADKIKTIDGILKK